MERGGTLSRWTSLHPLLSTTPGAYESSEAGDFRFSSAAEVARGSLHGMLDKMSGSAENDLG